jgi:hypothetical protein
MRRFFWEVTTIDTYSGRGPWILFGVSIQGLIPYFKEVTIYFLRWEFTFGYDWQAGLED